MQRGFYRGQFDLTGRVAVVTGATGLLGRHFCAALADHGAAVAVVDLDADVAAAFAGELHETYGVTCIGVATDIADPESVKAMAETVERRLGPIDILHSNAQALRRDPARYFAPAEVFDLGTWRDVMAVNLDGAFLVAQAIGARMAQRGHGSIIQTASIYGVVGPDQRIYEGSEYLGNAINTPPVYSASKAAVIGLTKYLAAYWGPHGIRVNTLTPGGVSSGQNAEFDRRYSARVPLGRMAKPDELTGALIFLASDAARYVNGQNLIVDGGLSAW
ncbi:SDR family oxidoreductase [Pseudorhodoplanes sp.]|uniref:SDR family oxidoreductase n=1 Tax=Pseudorhodoplanes sp. TaxID=1934341 RepID=UPI003D09DE25